MEINNQEDYEKGREMVREVEDRIIGLGESLELLSRILSDIEYVESYDVIAASELRDMLPDFIKKYGLIDRDIIKYLDSYFEQAKIIKVYDEERYNDLFKSTKKMRLRRE